MTNPPRKIITSSGKEILIFDNLFDLTARTYFYDFALHSKYSPLTKDTTFLEHGADFNLACHFSAEDLEAIKFLSHPSCKQLEKYFNGFNIKQVRINLTTLNDNNRIHVDNTKECKTLLYYLNLDWKLEWGGSLTIASEDVVEIEHSISCVPGRLIIMDGTLPHCISAPTNLAPTYRFSLVIQYVSE